MTAPERIVTERLVLSRDWSTADRAGLARMCGDPRLMRFMVKLWTPADADDAIARWQASFARHDYGIWCVTERKTGAFVGMVGVKDTIPGDPFPHSETEFAWRVDEPFWGGGYAGEAAVAAGNDAFRRAPIAGLMAYTTASNEASRRVMAKLGLAYRPEEDFDHPTLPADDHRKARVVYRITADAWRERYGHHDSGERTRKVAIYATLGDRLLVFRQPNDAEAGIQVPGGTADPGEDMETAARREFEEETGIALTGPLDKLGVADSPGRAVERHVFCTRLDGGFPEHWQHMEDKPSGGGPPILFELYWHDLADGTPRLAGDLGAFLPLKDGAR